MLKLMFTRFMALLYETLLLLALSLVITAMVYAVIGDASAGLKLVFLRAVLWLILAAYFVHCWVSTGQTLPNQTWHLKVVDAQGELLSRGLALKRYALASLLVLPLGLGFWWALIDREHCYLHDRLLGTRLINLKPARR